MSNFVDYSLVAKMFFCDDRTFVKVAYSTILGRDADPDGLSFYLNKLRSGVGRTAVLHDIAGSDEFKRRGCALDNGVKNFLDLFWRKSLFVGLGWQRAVRKRMDAVFLSMAEVHAAEIRIERERIEKVRDQVLSLRRLVGVAKLGGVYDLVLRSDLFDSDYYLKKYSDVADSGADPVSHYIEFGWREGRDPSEKFSTEGYLQIHSDVKKSDLNPLCHYLESGVYEGRKVISVPEFVGRRVYDVFGKEDTFPSDDVIDILIPVYNGFKFLQPLFDSILKNTHGKYRVFVIDDCSTDDRVLVFFNDLVSSKRFDSLHFEVNEKNLGFVGSVNRLVGLSSNDFVILNTDTEVPPGWLERLMGPVFREPGVASTTPFTNSGTIFSFPEYICDNKIYKGLDVAKVDSYFSRVSYAKTGFDVPTGVGFCMGFNRRVVDEIGMFDLEFGKGYSEENDWCMRAIRAGYRHVHVTNLFVYHNHGGSFSSEEKKTLQTKNYEKLLGRYPDYSGLVQKCVADDKARDVRAYVKKLIDRDALFESEVFRGGLDGVPVYYVGHLSAHSGVAQAARGNIVALESLGADLRLFDLADGGWVERFFNGFSEELPPVVVLHMTAAEIVNFAKFNGSNVALLKQLSHVVGVWAWESDMPSLDFELAGHFVSEVWAISSFTVPAFAGVEFVNVVNHVVEPWKSPLQPISLLEEIGRRHDFVVGYMCDLNSFSFRKNPEGVIGAFKMAFGGDGSAALVLKISSGEKNPKEYRDVLNLVKGFENIYIVTDRWSDGQIRFFYENIDVYLALFRAEGFGLTIAEAMGCGTPVVCANYSGVSDFAGDAILSVDSADVVIPFDWGPYKKGWVWKDPDVKHAAKILVELKNKPGLIGDYSARSVNVIKNKLSPVVISKQMMRSFERVVR